MVDKSGVSSRGRMNCNDVIAHLLAYLDNETDAETRGYIESHLEECRACLSRVEFEKALKARVRELGAVQSAESLRRRMKALIDKL